MKIEVFKHENVRPDGTFINEPGAVNVDGGITWSHPNGGCGLESCNCSEGHWVAICQPRSDNGVVEGISVKFENKAEMRRFIERGKFACQ